MCAPARVVALAVLAAAAPASGAGAPPPLSLLRGGGAAVVDRYGGGGKYAASMQPGVVASLLAKVEHDWIGRAMAALSGATSSDDALVAVQKSCAKVAGSIVDGSAGNRADVSEYMGDVCACDVRSSIEEQWCLRFKAALEHLMSEDESSNRDGFDYPGFCAQYYTVAVLKDAIDERKSGHSEAFHRARSGAEGGPRSRAEEKAASEAEEQSRRDAAARQEAADEASKEAVEEQVAFAKRAAVERLRRKVEYDEVERTSQEEVETEHEVREQEAMARKAAQKAAALRRAVVDGLAHDDSGLGGEHDHGY